MTFLPGFIGAGIAVMTFNGTATAVPAGGTPSTFASQPLGTAAADRIVVVALMYAAVGAISSMTIGGVAATKAVGVANGTSFSELWAAAVPTGTTGDVVLGSGSGTFPRLCISVYSLYGVSGVTPIATGTDTASPYSVDLAASTGCVAIGAFLNGSASVRVTWAGLTEDVDADNSSFSYSSASQSQVGGTLTTTVTPGTVATAAYVAAAWGP